jgi:hypothetical protein
MQVIQMVFGKYIPGTFHTRRCCGVRRGKKKHTFTMNEAAGIYLGRSRHLSRTHKKFLGKQVYFANFLDCHILLFYLFDWE